MKVVQVCTGYPPDRQGGVENVVRSLTIELRKKGVEVKVVARRWKSPIDDPDVMQLRAPKNEALGYGVWALRSSFVIRRQRPDVVHCHGLEGAIACRMLRGSSIRTVFHLHNSLTREKGYLDPLAHRVGHSVLSSACSSATMVVCPTEVVKRDVVDNIPGIDPRRIAVVPNMVSLNPQWDSDRLSRLKDALGLSGKRVILYFGKVKRSKGIEEICKAYEMMPTRKKTALVIAGAPTWTETFFSAMKKDFPDVVFTGFVEDPAPYYQLADIFCIYTDSFEGGETFAISLAEAVCRGVPVVCSDNPIFREVTEGSARFVESRNPSRLADAFEEALQASEPATGCGREGAPAVVRKYSPDTVAGQIERVYATALRLSTAGAYDGDTPS